ncbi:MAG: polyphenol oxidase family protein [Treponema sp.]|jgi:YfiH family protein|nr:polyphenol oxidase family protein [Treponema sp.]
MNISDNFNLYPFKIEADGGNYASFSFIYDGKLLDQISCVITLRTAGGMSLAAAREKFFSEFGTRDKKIFCCAQAHTRNVDLVTESDGRIRRDADGLVSKGRGIGLFVTVADCLPVFLFDTVSGSFSVLHSGWRGTGIVENALALMKKVYHSKPENVAAVLGPCIHSCCYNVDEERALSYKKEFGGGEEMRVFPLGPVVQHKKNGAGMGWYIDMQAANAALLAKNGVRNIAYCVNCTFTDEIFGSFRREGARDYTKMIALAMDSGNAGIPEA